MAFKTLLHGISRLIRLALRAGEDKYRIVADFTYDWEYWVGTDGTYLYVSPSCERITGYKPEEFIRDPKFILRILHPEDKEKAAEHLIEIREHLEDHLEFRILTRSGEVRWIDHRCQAVYGADGVWLGRRASNRDITAQKEAEERIILLSQQLERRVAERTEQLEAAVKALESEIAERRHAEEELAWKARADEAIAELAQALLARRPVEDISYLVLEHAKRLTGSPFGYVGYIDPHTGHLVSSTLTRDIWDLCQVEDKSFIFTKFSGLWGWVLRHRQPLLTNNPQEDPRSSGVPKGHIPIERFISVPALLGETLVGQIALANAPHDYTERDLRLLERLASLYALAIQRQRAEEALRAVVEGTASAVGVEFFRSLVSHLAEALQVRYAMVTQGVDRPITKVRTLAFWMGESWGEDFEYSIAGTPSEEVLRGERRHYPEGLQSLFPHSLYNAWNAQSYMGVPLVDTANNVIGHLAVLDDRPMKNDIQTKEHMMQIFAARAAAELERRQTELALQQALEESRRSNAQIAALLEAARFILEQRRFTETAYYICTSAQRLVGATAGYLATIGRDCALNDVVNTFGQPLPDSVKGLCVRACGSGRVVHANTLTHHSPVYNALCAPLRVRNEVVGVLGLANKEQGFTEEDTVTMLSFAELAALALQNSRLLESLQESAADLERSNRDLQQFAYVISHDLQEPLRMVASYLRLLEQRYQTELDSQAREFIGYAVDGAIRLQDMIKALLDLSRVETRGKEFAPTDCEALLARVLHDLHFAIEESGAVITHDPMPTVLADEAQLGQVFQNLIENAIKFRRQDEPPRIHVSAQRHLTDRKPGGSGWLFSVRDNGIGIDPAQFERIFQIFQRLHTREEYPGTGIGLALCRRIVERHGGRMWVESQPGHGSTFYFTIETG
ncbi:MAG: GAF domain-containing protein [Anaerolineae bacterium]|nr:GAF domain-containing protein [Anaerolineae bacterium]